MMELKRELGGLIERAWALHDGLSEKIRNSNISFCSFCSEHGGFCNIVEEKEGLIAIRDSLKEVGDVLMHLQRLRSWQPIDRQQALSRLEGSRLNLMEKVKQYRGRECDVVEELKTCFSNGNTVVFYWKWNINDKKKSKSGELNLIGVQKEKGFPVGWIKALWKWQRSACIGAAAKLILVSATILCTVRFSHARLHCRSSHSLMEPVDPPPTKETSLYLPNRKNTTPLNVFYGRG